MILFFLHHLSKLQLEWKMLLKKLFRAKNSLVW